MTQYIEKPIIATLHVKVPAQAEKAFAEWQAKMNSAITGMPGFISVEFLSNGEWIIVQRFVDAESAANWKHSPQWHGLMQDLKKMVPSNGIREAKTEESKLSSSVTEVIVTEVNPAKEEDYRHWSSKIHQVEATFPGFRGVYVQSPNESKGRHWITLLQFDTAENLDCWLNSSERRKVLGESSSLISSLETHRVISPYAGWFASIVKKGELPPLWKQTMIILLVLFPIVMMEMKFLSPLTAGLDVSPAMFISNAISVTLISFPMMPIAIWFLGWWLTPDQKKWLQWTIIGTLVVLALYVLEILIFWKFVP